MTETKLVLLNVNGCLSTTGQMDCLLQARLFDVSTESELRRDYPHLTPAKIQLTHSHVPGYPDVPVTYRKFLKSSN